METDRRPDAASSYQTGRPSPGDFRLKIILLIINNMADAEKEDVSKFNDELLKKEPTDTEPRRNSKSAIILTSTNQLWNRNFEALDPGYEPTGPSINITPHIQGKVTSLTIDKRGEAFIIGTSNGKIYHWKTR